MKKVIRINENDLNIIVSKVLNENTSLQDKLFKTIDRIGLLKTIESIGYNTFNDILPDYFQDRNNKIKLISTITEDGIHAYEIIDSDIKIDERDEWDGKEADYITYFNGDYVTITTYGFDEGDFMIDDPVDDWSVNLVDLRSKIIDLIFYKMVNKLFYI